MEHHKQDSDCPCSKDILERLDESITSLQVSGHHIRILRRDKFELVEMLKELIAMCPADPDSTKKFLSANQRAASLIQKHSS